MYTGEFSVAAVTAEKQRERGENIRTARGAIFQDVTS